MKKLLAAIAVSLLAAGCASQSGGGTFVAGTSAPSAIDSFSPEPDSTTPPAAPAPSLAPTSVPPQAVPAMTGLLADPATISQRLPAAPTAECVTAGDNPYPLGTRYAWRVGGALVCSDVTSTWQNHPINFDVYFGLPVSQAQALAVTEQLLPADASNPIYAEGTNDPETSSHPNGTCEVVGYDSPSAGAGELALDPSWRTDNKVHVILYTGQSLDDGSDSAYAASTVRYAAVGIQADLDTGGFVPC